MKRGAACAVAIACLLGATGAVAAPRVSMELDGTMDVPGRRFDGRVRLRVVNDCSKPLTEAPLWLYPNALAEPAPDLRDVNWHWFYPGSFDAAGIDLLRVQAGGVEAPVTLEDGPGGRATRARVTLPVPVPPGQTLDLDVQFHTRIPRRLGGFGCASGQCRLLGGFYPVLAAWKNGAFDLEAPAPRLDARVHVNVAGARVAFVSGRRVPESGVVDFSIAGTDGVSIVADDNLKALSVDDVPGGPVYWHRSSRWGWPRRVELVAQTARAALAFLRTQQLNVPIAGGGVTLFETPMRHELVRAHDQSVFVSEDLLRIFPLDTLRKFHRLELVRAVLTAQLVGPIAEIEPEDPELAAQVAATFLTDLFARHAEGGVESARDLLSPFSFIPEVDQLIYAPLVASSSTYFGDVDAQIVARDDARRFAAAGAGPRLLYNKLLDLLGTRGMAQVVAVMLRERVSLRVAADRAFGAPLDWFFRQWQGARPRVNYHLGRVQREPLGGGREKVSVTIVRQGDAVVEPVVVRVTDRKGGNHDLVWKDAGIETTLTTELPAALSSVEIDPGYRLAETATGSLDRWDDPRADNRDPRRIRLLYSGLGALLNISELRANLYGIFTLKRQHDLRRRMSFVFNHTEATTLGLSASHGWLFGTQADRNNLTSAFTLGLGVDRLNPSFARAFGSPPVDGWRLSGRMGLGYDDRGYLIDPWRAVGFGLAARYSLTALDDGTTLSQATVAAEALRLFQLAPGQVLALDLEGGLTFGQLRIRQQLLRAGGPAALRGFGADELFGRGQILGRAEYRHRIVSNLAWNLGAMTWVRAIGGTAFVDSALITGCENLSFARRAPFTSVGYSLRFLHDALGVYQSLVSIDVAVPLNRRERFCMGVSNQDVVRPDFVVLVTFLPQF